MSAARRATKPNRAIPWIAAAAMLLIALAIILRDPLGRVLKGRFACDSGIEYNGRTYNLKAALALLKLEGKGADVTIRPASDLIQLFLRDAQDMCYQAEQGRVSSADYLAYRSKATQRLAALIALVQSAPNPMTPEMLPTYVSALNTLNPNVPDKPSSLTVRVMNKDGAEMKSGAVLRSGDFYYLEIDARPQGYLYVYSLTSQNTLLRLYPSAAGGSVNPVEGIRRIPTDSTQAMQLDGHPGIEHVLVFLESTPNEQLAGSGAEIAENRTSPRPAEVQYAQQLMQLRGSQVSQLPTPTISADVSAIQSHYGNVAVDFLIDHR